MRFQKMQGAGNDFIFIKNFSGDIPENKYGELAKKLCDRRFSIGADGIVYVCRSNIADIKFVFYNADGTRGEMCGNGARCITKYAIDNRICLTTQAKIETDAGIVVGEKSKDDLYTIRLNDPENYQVVSETTQYVELGHPGIPHAVVKKIGWQSMDRNELREEGKKVRNHPYFPKGANVTFWDNTNGLDCITFERGVEDFTLACGTGAGATAYCLNKLGIVKKDCELSFPGGILRIQIKDGIYLSGPAETVYTGEIQIKL